MSIIVYFPGYLKKIKKSPGESYADFVRKVRAKDEAIPADPVFQYLDENDDLIHIDREDELQEYLESVEKPRLCIKDYSCFPKSPPNSTISASQDSMLTSKTKEESAILAEEERLTSMVQTNERVEECGEISVAIIEETSTKIKKRDYRREIYRLFNPSEEWPQKGPQITEEDLEKNSLQAVKIIRHASRPLVDSIINDLSTWEKEWQAKRR